MTYALVVSSICSWWTCLYWYLRRIQPCCNHCRCLILLLAELDVFANLVANGFKQDSLSVETFSHYRRINLIAHEFGTCP